MHDDDFDKGLRFDLGTLAQKRAARRQVLGAFAAFGLSATLAACGSAAEDDVAAGGGGSSAGGGGSGPRGSGGGGSGEGSCAEIPDETEGPYPGDGTNGPNALTIDGVLRSDITSSFGDSTGVAGGIPTRVELTVLDADGCAPLPGAAVYLWHCTREGGYSMYSAGVEDENFLRGVQVADGDGRVVFETIMPGCYDGRWPHMHFEVYASLDDATSGTNAIKTSQLAIPEDTASEAYATDGYESSVTNLARVSLEDDGIFRDGVESQLASAAGNANDGYTLTLEVAV